MQFQTVPQTTNSDTLRLQTSTINQIEPSVQIYSPNWQNLVTCIASDIFLLDLTNMPSTSKRIALLREKSFWAIELPRQFQTRPQNTNSDTLNTPNQIWAIELPCIFWCHVHGMTRERVQSYLNKWPYQLVCWNMESSKSFLIHHIKKMYNIIQILKKLT